MLDAPEYEALLLCLKIAHIAAEAAMTGARRVRLDEGRAR